MLKPSKKHKTIDVVCTVHTLNLFWVQSICSWMVKFWLNGSNAIQLGMCPRSQCLFVCLFVFVCHKELWVKQIFPSIFDILFEFVINITSLWLSEIPKQKKSTSLKTLTKANLTSSIEIRCHTEWIAWKTSTTVNWKLLQSVFLTVYFALLPSLSFFLALDIFAIFQHNLKLEVRVWALIKHAYAICLQCVIWLYIYSFCFGDTVIFTHCLYFCIWFSNVILHFGEWNSD